MLHHIVLECGVRAELLLDPENPQNVDQHQNAIEMEVPVLEVEAEVVVPVLEEALVGRSFRPATLQVQEVAQHCPRPWVQHQRFSHWLSSNRLALEELDKLD